MSGVEYRICAEIGAMRYRICAYRNGMAAAYLIGYMNPSSGIVKLYPKRELFFGALAAISKSYPVRVYFPNMAWRNSKERNQHVQA